MLVVAPIFFGPGNLESLRVALRAVRAGKKVLLADSPPMRERDLSDGEATDLGDRLVAAGAVRFSEIRRALEIIAEITVA